MVLNRISNLVPAVNWIRSHNVEGTFIETDPSSRCRIHKIVETYYYVWNLGWGEPSWTVEVLLRFDGHSDDWSHTRKPVFLSRLRSIILNDTVLYASISITTRIPKRIRVDLASSWVEATRKVGSGRFCFWKSCCWHDLEAFGVPRNVVCSL